MRSSLVEGQKQIDSLEQQNIQLTRKLADQVSLVEQTKNEMAATQNDARVRIERLENNVRVLCQNIESSNSILSMRSRKVEEPKRVESTADIVRREMAEWQNNHEAEQDSLREIEALAAGNDGDDVDDMVSEEDLKFLLSSENKSKRKRTRIVERIGKKADKASPYLQSNSTPVNRRNSKSGTPNAKAARARASLSMIYEVKLLEVPGW